MPKKYILFFTTIVVITFGFAVYRNLLQNKISHELNQVLPETDPENSLTEWKRPEGPPKIGIQVGHLNAAEAPEEQKNLRSNTGTTGGGKAEWEVNQTIAEETAKLLREQGILVDILPTTVPPSYWADAFVSIHADGNLDTRINGYKIAGPRRDWSKSSKQLVEILDKTYEQVGLSKDSNISRNMTGYYAFAWWRFEHAIHPMTAAAIVETGFLTNYADRQVLINTPEIPAKAIADGLIEFLISKNLIVS